MHHVSGRAKKTLQGIWAKENPEKKGDQEEAEAPDLWRCPYCEWTGKTQNALKSHITREHKD